MYPYRKLILNSHSSDVPETVDIPGVIDPNGDSVTVQEEYKAETVQLLHELCFEQGCCLSACRGTL